MWSSIITVLLPAIGKLALGLLDYWVKYQNVDDKFLKSYYEFLKEIDNNGIIKGSTLKSADDCKKRLLERLEASNEKPITK